MQQDNSNKGELKNDSLRPQGDSAELEDKIPKVMLLQANFDTRNMFIDYLEKKGHNNIDASGSRALFEDKGQFVKFRQDIVNFLLSKGTRTRMALANTLKRIMYITDPGLAIVLDFPEDGASCIEAYAKLPFEDRPSSQKNWLSEIMESLVEDGNKQPKKVWSRDTTGRLINA